MARKSRRQVAADNGGHGTEDSLRYRAAAYVRLSSDDTGKRGDSLETQRNIIENHIAAIPDIQLAEVYTDNNATGTNFNRPGFQQMLADVQCGRINCVIVKDLTRFGRNAIDSGYYLEKYLPSLGVRFIAVTDSYDSNDGNGGIMLPLKNIISESYALDISRKCKAVQRQNMLEGRFIGRMAPYGYLKAPDDCHKLIADPETAPVVRQIFGWASKGANPREIVRRLNAGKVLSPSLHKKSLGLISGKTISPLWHHRTITDMLGDMVQGKKQKTNHKEFAVDKSKWITVENTHQAIVSRELFAEVQQVRKQISIEDRDNRTRPVAYSTNLFKGKIFCAKCGRAMNRKRQNKDGVYWFRCESQWKYGKETCVQVSVKESDLLEQLLATLKKYSEILCRQAVTLWNCRAEIKSKEAAAQKEITEIRHQLSQNGNFLRSLYESLVSEIITKDEFQRMKAEYQKKIADLKDRAEALEEKRQADEQQNNDKADLFEYLRDVKLRPDITTRMIDALVDKILVHPDKSVTIHFKFKDEFSEVQNIG